MCNPVCGYRIKSWLRKIRRPLRLEAQDSALSRRQQGFESPWGRQQTKKGLQLQALFCLLVSPRDWFEPPVRQNCQEQFWTPQAPEGRKPWMAFVNPPFNKVLRLLAAQAGPFLFVSLPKGLVRTPGSTNLPGADLDAAGARRAAGRTARRPSPLNEVSKVAARPSGPLFLLSVSPRDWFGAPVRQNRRERFWTPKAPAGRKPWMAFVTKLPGTILDAKGARRAAGRTARCPSPPEPSL